MAAPTLDAAIKGASANSYVTQATAQTYFDGRFATTAWEAASSTAKDRALIMATARLEHEQYAGTMTTTTQALKWPRTETYDDDGNHYDPDLMPAPMQEATYETALELLDGTLTFAPTGLEGFDSVKVGTLVVDPRHSRKAGSLSATVRRLLRNVLVTSSSGVLRTGKT